MSEIDIELDGKKLWPALQYVPGELVGVALLTNEQLTNGDGVPSLALRIVVRESEADPEPLTILCEVKVATLLMVLASVRGRLEHLEAIRQMVASVKH